MVKIPKLLTILCLVTLGLGTVPPAVGGESPVQTSSQQTPQGLIHVKSSHSVSITSERLIDVLKAKGLTLFARIDHTAGAKSVGQSLRPTEVVVFGNPKVGTPLMQCSQTTAIDLPQKALIWEDRMGQVWLSYNHPQYLANRHHIENCGEVLTKVEQALAKLAQAVTQP